MEKYIAFGLYRKNAQGGHQPTLGNDVHGVQVYLADQVDARLAEAERILRAELLTDVGQREEQWCCLCCMCYGPKVESIAHAADCDLNRFLMVSATK